MGEVVEFCGRRDEALRTAGEGHEEDEEEEETRFLGCKFGDDEEEEETAGLFQEKKVAEADHPPK